MLRHCILNIFFAYQLLSSMVTRHKSGKVLQKEIVETNQNDKEALCVYTWFPR